MLSVHLVGDNEKSKHSFKKQNPVPHSFYHFKVKREQDKTLIATYLIGERCIKQSFPSNSRCPRNFSIISVLYMRSR